MKQLTILTAFILASLFSYSQTYLSVAGGISTPGNKPLMNLNIGYKFPHCLLLEYDMRVVVSNKMGEEDGVPDNPCHLGFRLSAALHPVTDLKIVPGVGYYYRMVSSDDPRLNGWDMSYGGRIRYNFLVAEYSRVGKYDQFSLGIIFVTKNH